MARKVGSKNKSTLEFVQLYDQLVTEYGCPVTALFKIANGRYKTELKVNAIKCLLPYRFAKRVAESDEQIKGQLTLVWDADKPGQEVTG